MAIYLTTRKVGDHQHRGISSDERRVWLNKVFHICPILLFPNFAAKHFPTRTQKSGIEGKEGRKRGENILYSMPYV